jgi:K(+)-stimulated pyrophosphate-energized sodium pump
MMGGILSSSLDTYILWAILGIAIIGLAYAVFLIRQILREDEGTEKMKKVSGAIRLGANAYLKRQFKAIASVIIILAIALYLTAQDSNIGFGRAVAFLVGAIFSATVGYVGMNMATLANVRVANAARKNLADALRIAYRTGTIVGMLTDGLGLLGGTVIFMLYGDKAYEVLLGFGFGATLIALFMRVGGGIYTKAADIGADLVGKIENDIPEDDPRNAAVIADLVGDNVGDCAGMAADIFESYEITIVSAMILGYAAFGHLGVIFPLMVRGIGVLSSMIGTYAVRSKSENESAMKAISRGYNLSALVSILGFILIAEYYANDMRFFWATFVGIILAVMINYTTEHFTSIEKDLVKEIAKSTTVGAATTILTGLAVGFESSVWAIVLIAATIAASALIFYGAGPLAIAYGVSLAGIGMLTLTGNTISMDAFGPIADNANGIAEMAQLDKTTRKRLASLDAVGNTTKAITKGVAIGSAVIAAVSLFQSYTEMTGLAGIRIDKVSPLVFVGFLIGGAVPFLFSSLILRAVGRAANLIVEEVRRQFREIKGLWKGLVDPDYAKVIDICTVSAQKELIALGVIAILTPVVIGLLLHEEALGGFLAGAILSSQLLAVFMSTSGGAWDNAKKSIEDGLYGGKGSEAHKASIVGDTVGDPLKDTAGPALNPMIKVINLVSLLIAPLILANEQMTLQVYAVIALLLIALFTAIWYSKKEAYIGVNESLTRK